MLDEEKSCWMKFWWWANFPSNIFTLIHQSFHVGSVYTLFHPIFPSYDVISNVRTSNCQWFNKTKTLCKIVAIKKSHTSNWNEREQLHTHQSIFLNADLSSTVSYFIMFWKEPNWCLCIIQSRVLPQRGFSSRHLSFVTSSINHGWKNETTCMLDDTHKRYKLSSNILSNILDKMLYRFN